MAAAAKGTKMASKDSQQQPPPAKPPPPAVPPPPKNMASMVALATKKDEEPSISDIVKAAKAQKAEEDQAIEALKAARQKKKASAGISDIVAKAKEQQEKEEKEEAAAIEALKAARQKKKGQGGIADVLALAKKQEKEESEATKPEAKSGNAASNALAAVALMAKRKTAKQPEEAVGEPASGGTMASIVMAAKRRTGRAPSASTENLTEDQQESKSSGGGLAAVVAAAKRRTGRGSTAASTENLNETGEGGDAEQSKGQRLLQNILRKRESFTSGGGDQDGGDTPSGRTSRQGGQPGASAAAANPATGAPNSKTISAPTSPLKERKGFFGKVSTFSQAVSAKVEQAKDAAGSIRGGYNKDRNYVLLVIDDADTDWSKYFRGRRIFDGQYDIRVEQAEFDELAVSANTESGTTASIIMQKSGNKVVRSFKPDFLLIRQNLRHANEDNRNHLLGFQYSDIPSVNTLHSIYNFQDKPWVFGQMQAVRKKLGKDKFPLIEQTYYPNYREMLSTARFPCVIKIGHAHNGVGKVKIENSTQFNDIISVLTLSESYCTVEPFIEAKYDLHIQKIGSNYKAMMRKSLSGNWKTNIGQSILEEIEVKEEYKVWIDGVSEIFGGLDIVSLEAVVGKDGKEHIIEMNDSATTLMGESQEEDRKHITELVIQRMEEWCITPTQPTAGAAPAATSGSTANATAAAPSPIARQLSRSSMNKVVEAATSSAKKASASAGPPPPPPRPGPSGVAQPPASRDVENARKRHDSQDSTDDSSASESSSVSSVSSSARNKNKGKGKKSVAKSADDEDEDEDEVGSEADAAGTGDAKDPNNPESEDTMKNLRKTFAGIFGDSVN